jgi:hypothetical protein
VARSSSMSVMLGRFMIASIVAAGSRTTIVQLTIFSIPNKGRGIGCIWITQNLAKRSSTAATLRD